MLKLQQVNNHLYSHSCNVLEVHVKLLEEQSWAIHAVETLLSITYLWVDLWVDRMRWYLSVCAPVIELFVFGRTSVVSVVDSRRKANIDQTPNTTTVIDSTHIFCLESCPASLILQICLRSFYTATEKENGGYLSSCRKEGRIIQSVYSLWRKNVW